MQLQIISDIHLELRNNRYPKIPKKASYIALLGDIGKPFSSAYKRLIQDLSKRFEGVIIVAGNHEFYSSVRRKITVRDVREEIVRIANLYSNVSFLDNNTLFLEGVRILGCTLWTSIPSDMWSTVRRKMNDYHMCYIEKYSDIDVGVPLSPQHTVFWHDESVAWLKQELSSPGHLNTPTIILTHHCPYHTQTSHPRYEDNELQCCYSTDLSFLFDKPVVAWAYGHTHFPADQTINGMRLVSNPLGYPDELETADSSLKNPPIIIV